MLRSAANPRAAAIIRAGIERHVGARFAAGLEGANVQARSELGLALLAGVWLMRTVIATRALQDTRPELLTERLSGMLAAVVDP
jgi:hypothetical protein